MDALHRGRSAFAANAWTDAVAGLAEADRAAPLGPDDLERLASAAYLTGRDAESADAWARAHHELLARGEPRRAARCAIWLGFGLLLRGETARASGWMARARRVLADGPPDLAEHGFLLWADAFRTIMAGDPVAALAGFEQAAAIGERRHDPDVAALGRVGAGRARIRLGDTGAGVALLDEVMVAVETGELSPIVVGDLYCTVIEGCQELFDLRRAQQWTAVLTGWCAAQQDLVPYRGQCLLHRAELLTLHGAWPDAMEETRQAAGRFLEPAGHPAAGAAAYQQGELHRLRGEAADAEAAYRQASRWGREPQPGLALLRLAQGQTAAAVAAIRRALDEAGDPVARARLLPAQVEIALAAGDVPAARAAAGELAGVAADLEAPLLAATAAAAEGAVLLAEGDPRAALAALRGAWTAWSELEAPYEAARAREGIGLACRALGDQDSAALELDAARWAYQRLGAAPDLARVEALASDGGLDGTAGGLTAREVEVLRLVATGRTNRAIAAELVLSERTVDRHVSNILTKLGVPSRAAATAWAYEHRLV
ncbi:MAG TPA: helix-turn-helix transcriptional regulator [Actinomycetota bacterium]|nr:helix-turn-helix transcriptional regulator [Actinomycetota bacterium]